MTSLEMIHPYMCFTDFYIIKTLHQSSIPTQFNSIRVNGVKSVCLKLWLELLRVHEKETHTMSGLKDIRV